MKINQGDGFIEAYLSDGKEANEFVMIAINEGGSISNAVLSHSEAIGLARAILNLAQPKKPVKAKETAKDGLSEDDIQNIVEAAWRHCNLNAWPRHDWDAFIRRALREGGTGRANHRWEKTNPDWIEAAAKEIARDMASDGGYGEAWLEATSEALARTIRKHAPKS